MKRYYIAAAIVAAVNLAIYPLMNRLAYLERGYNAHGGEDILFIFGFFAALMVISHGWEKTRQLKEERMKYTPYKSCPTCGAHLDPCERCSDCDKKKNSLPKSKLPFTESEQSESHFDARSIYHKQPATVNQKEQ